jgi:hypothetical protein
MNSIVINKRFCGPPNSANGGYVCGLLATHIQGSAEITLLAPPPLDRRLDLVVAEHGATLRQGETTLATGRPVRIDALEIPIVGFCQALDAVRQSPYDERSHPLPTCFVCGPARSDGDGLRIIPRPIRPCPGYGAGTVAAPWVPYANLAGGDGAVAEEYIWAALDCPTGFASVGAQHLGMTGTEAVLLGRMGARIERRPRPEEHCVVVAWPTGRDRRKLFANSALLSSSGELLAVAQATWLLLNRPDDKFAAGASSTSHLSCD